MPRRADSCLSRRRPALWKVVIHGVWRPIRRSTRSCISRAALLVKVIARMRSGRTCLAWMRLPMRWVMTRVLPEPAPATTSKGPSRVAIASFCGSFMPLKGSNMGAYAPERGSEGAKERGWKAVENLRCRDVRGLTGAAPPDRSLAPSLPRSCLIRSPPESPSLPNAHGRSAARHQRTPPRRARRHPRPARLRESRQA